MNELKFAEISNEESLKQFIDNRLIELYKSAQPRKIVGFENLGPHKGIVPKETIIDNGGAYYKIKNDDYIYLFISLLIKNHITDLDKILNNIYPFLNMYFGKNGDSDLRIAIFNQNTLDGIIPDISVLKQRNAAMCSERAAMAQNIFSFLGIESYYITGEIVKNGENVPHAFNIIKYNNRYLIYDATTDVPVYNDDKIVGYQFYIQEIDIEKFLSNSQVTISDYCLEYRNNQYIRKKIGERIYSSWSSINKGYFK